MHLSTFARPRRLAAALAVLALAAGVAASAQEKPPTSSYTHYYVVRHAEKLDPKDPDSPLAPDGETRAKTLAALLAAEGIDRVFVSQFKRTRQTAAPTEQAFKLGHEEFDARDVKPLIATLKKAAGEDVLVVAHSDSVHVIVNELLAQATEPTTEAAKRIAEDEFGRLWIVTKHVFNGTTVTRLETHAYEKSLPPR